ncbi:MAG TPA: hypothetical protein VIU41_02075 [Geobacteraceae bacterium]
MRFSIDPSLTFVNISETTLYHLFRSVGAVVPMDDRYGKRPCEAYICSSKTDKGMQLFVAVIDAKKHLTTVYRSAVEPKNNDEYGRLLKEAQQFAASLGFAMEQVNVEFSAAMRQVIMKDIRVLRPPPPSREKQRSQVAPPQSSSDKVAQESPVTGAPAKVALSAIALAQATLPVADGSGAAALAELTAARAELARLACDKTAAEQAAEARHAALAAELTEALAGRARAEESLAQGLAVAVFQEDEARKTDADHGQLVAELSCLRKEIATVGRERDDALAKLSTVEAGLVAMSLERDEFQQLLNEERASRETELATAAADRELLVKELRAELAVREKSLLTAVGEAAKSVALAEALATTKDELAAAIRANELAQAADADLGTLRHDLAAATAERAALADQLAEAGQSLVALQEQHETELIAIRQELSALAAEKVAVLAELSGKQAELAKVQAETTRLTEEHELALAAMTAEVIAAREATAAAEAALSSQAAEWATGQSIKDYALAESNEALAVGRAEIAQLSRELLMVKEAAGREMAALNDELQRLRVDQAEAAAVAQATPRPHARKLPGRQRSGGQWQPVEPAVTAAPVASPPLAAPVSPVVTNETPVVLEPPVTAVAAPAPVISQSLLAGLTEEFAGIEAIGADTAADFRLEPQLPAIPFMERTDFIALYESVNKVQAMPAGQAVDKYTAYICAVRHGDQIRLYNAWQQCDSRRVLIYVPPRQPADQMAYEKLLQDALFYFESTGFMMEPVELGNASTSRLQEFESAAVLCKVSNG